MAGQWESSYYKGDVKLTISERKNGVCIYQPSGALPSIGRNAIVGFNREGGFVYDNKRSGDDNIVIFGKYELLDQGTIKITGIESHGEGSTSGFPLRDTWTRTR